MALPRLITLISLQNKREIEVDGVQIIDLTEPIIEFKSELNIIQPPVLVTKEFEMRPDLIAKVVYGSEDHVDLLLLFNGYSNPLMIEKGMYLQVPELDSMISNTKNNNAAQDVNVSKNNFNKKLPEKDKKRIEKMIADAQGISPDDVEIKPPNIPADGTKPVTPVDGRIILGTNISDTRCKDKLSEVQTMSEMIRQSVKDKILSGGAGISPVGGKGNISASQGQDQLSGVT